MSACQSLIKKHTEFVNFMTIRSVMALIRRVGSLYPCPRCLVAEVDLDNFPSRAQARTAEQTKATIEEVRQQDLVGESEEILKNSGLRDIDVHSHFISELFYR